MSKFLDQRTNWLFIKWILINKQTVKMSINKTSTYQALQFGKVLDHVGQFYV